MVQSVRLGLIAWLTCLSLAASAEGLRSARKEQPVSRRPAAARREAGVVPARSREQLAQDPTEAWILRPVKADVVESAAKDEGDKGSTLRASASAEGTNDACASATSLGTQTGTFAFDNRAATEDGPAHAACIDEFVSPLGNIAHDVWYCWTAAASGVVQVDTCGLTVADTKLAVYDGCACPVTDDRLVNMGCNDDGCGLQSSVSFVAQAGQSYLVRLGTYPGNKVCSGGTNAGRLCVSGTDCPDGTCTGTENAAPGGVGFFSVEPITLPCDLPGVNCQGADPENGFRSDRVVAVVADDFTPAASGDLTELCWEGSYILDISSPDSFEVTYYDNVGGLPGSVVGGPFRQSQGTLLVDGPINNATGVDFPVFAYHGSHAPVAVEAGRCYWIEITDDTGGNAWFWQTGLPIEGNGSYLHDVAPEGGVRNGYDAGDLSQADLAFCLSGPLGEVIFCPSAPQPGCGSTPSSCCQINATPSCSDTDCCSRVCACDPFCCTTRWDSNCSQSNTFVPGCDATTRCPSLCASCTTLVSGSPPHCTIDARQPSDIDGTNATGVTQIELTFNAECDAAALPQGFFQVESSSGATVPAIQSVSASANRATLTVSPFIPPRSWTCFSHRDTAGRVCVGYLPGDVNGDSTANPAIDLGALIDCINSPGSCTALQANIDRLGTTPGALDITRLIDLFNGAGAFESTTGATIGACPSP